MLRSTLSLRKSKTIKANVIHVSYHDNKRQGHVGDPAFFYGVK